MLPPLFLMLMASPILVTLAIISWPMFILAIRSQRGTTSAFRLAPTSMVTKSTKKPKS